MRKKSLNYLIVIIVGVAAPWLVNLVGGYWVHLLIIIGIFSILGVSLNLLLGYTGRLNIAHIAFFGLGAYTSGLLMIHFDVSFWVAMLAAGIAALILGLFIGFVALRLRGIYFAMTTFAFLMLMRYVLLNMWGLTKGTSGLTGIPRPSIGGFVFGATDRIAWFYLVFVFLLLTYFIVGRVVNSRLGRSFVAIREDEDLAMSSGINTFRYKMISFCISVFFAGIAGALYASYMGCMTPSDCDTIPGILVIASCVIGGLGTMPGPIIGAAIVQLLPELLRPAQEYYYLIFGALLVLTMIYVPDGVLSIIKQLWARFKVRASKEEARQVG